MKPIVLCILDGVGHREEEYGNALKKAHMPFLNGAKKNFAYTLLEASGEAVGLPSNTMGNSEVGHMNIGAGKIVYQPSEFINSEINNGEFYKNKKILKFFKEIKDNASSLHLIGMISDGRIHSTIEHLLPILKMAKDNNLDKVYLHLFTDGRDMSPTSSPKIIKTLETFIQENEIGKIVTVMGRYYGMDRDNRWDRVKKAYDAIVNREGEFSSDLYKSIENSYARDITDEFIEPIILDKNIKINDKDGIFMFNFRPDRLRELGASLTNPDFNEFPIKKLDIKLLTLMPVSDEVICENVYSSPKVDTPFGVYISNLGLKQLRIAETEKYAHVTYFFDGGIERDLKGCDRILIPSKDVEFYDQTPEVGSIDITNQLVEEITKDKYDIVIVNYANGDLVGHTGNFDAAVKSLEILDGCLSKLYDKVKEKDGLLIITADHGNCELMLDTKGEVDTKHELSKVPFIICKENQYKLHEGKLSDIAPTIIDIMKLPKPKEMTGRTLIEANK